MILFGEKLGQSLPVPSVVELIGDVGTGKTTITKGIAKGLGIDEDIRGFIAAFGIVALALLVWKRRSFFGPGRLAAVAEPLLYAGILGNVVDRVFRGHVIDMFDFHWGAHHFPCFNVADTLISVAVGLLVLSSFVGPRPAPAD